VFTKNYLGERRRGCNPIERGIRVTRKKKKERRERKKKHGGKSNN